MDQTLALVFNDIELGYEAADEAMARAFRKRNAPPHLCGWNRSCTPVAAEGWPTGSWPG